MLLNLFYHNHEAGFFCNDQSLKYPYKRSIVSIEVVLAMSIILPLFIFGVTTHFTDTKPPNTTSSNKFLPRLYKTFYTYYFGISSCTSIMWVPKYLSGGLRPYFFELCQPVMADNSTCDDPRNHGVFIEDYTCSAADPLPHDVFRTFPSGHATIISYTMTYMTIFLQISVKERYVLVRYFTQLAFICTAFYVSLSRISDHHHHPEDVAAGMVLGCTTAVMYIKYYVYEVRSVADDSTV